MDILILTCSIILILLGIIGSFLPVLPGPLTSWGGLLLIHYHTLVPQDNTFIWITFRVALVIFILDYFIPALGAKKFGGTKYGSYGATIGLFIGLISPVPFGILIGPFLGAYTGELINDSFLLLCYYLESLNKYYFILKNEVLLLINLQSNHNTIFIYEIVMG